MPPRLKIIGIPRTPATAFDQHRLISDLVRNQVYQAHRELHDWWRTLGSVKPEQVQTEQQAAEYLKAVTRILHPEGTRPPAPAAAGKRKRGISLGERPRASRPARRRPRKTSRKRR